MKVLVLFPSGNKTGGRRVEGSEGIRVVDAWRNDGKAIDEGDAKANGLATQSDGEPDIEVERGKEAKMDKTQMRCQRCSATQRVQLEPYRKSHRALMISFGRERGRGRGRGRVRMIVRSTSVL